MPDPVVVPPPVTAGKRPPLPKTSPKGPEEKRSPEERSKGVVGGRSKAVPILVASSAKHAAAATAAAQEEARHEIQLLRARSSGGRDGPRGEGEGGLQKKEAQEVDHEYTAPRGPASLADFAVTITKAKGRGFSKAAASSQSPEARKGQEQVRQAGPGGWREGCCVGVKWWRADGQQGEGGHVPLCSLMGGRNEKRGTLQGRGDKQDTVNLSVPLLVRPDMYYSSIDLTGNYACQGHGHFVGNPRLQQQCPLSLALICIPCGGPARHPPRPPWRTHSRTPRLLLLLPLHSR
jgi:hypothetical protein